MTPLRPLAALLVAALLGALALAATGCGGDDTPTASASDVAKEIRQRLSPKLPQKTKDVTCTRALAGKVGQAENCVLTYESGTKVQVRVTVTSVTDGRIDFNMLVTRKL